MPSMRFMRGREVKQIPPWDPFRVFTIRCIWANRGAL